MAERVGFEPTVRIKRTTIFETVAFDHSAISPRSSYNIALVCGYSKAVLGKIAKIIQSEKQKNF